MLVAVVVSLGAGETLAGKRIALVIGNSAYRHAPKLPNPRNDAQAIAAALRRLKFDVVYGVDLDKPSMERLLQKFAAKIESADVALIYYAGHGMQVGGRNFLVPVDAQLQRESDLHFQAVSLRLIQSLMEQGQRTNILILDACRDNPLAHNLSRSMGTRSTRVGAGLGQTQAGVGTLIVYATQPGNVALDGKGRHSPFTKALLDHIETPGLEVRQILSRVRRTVIKATDGKQVPWDSSSLTGDVFLAAAAKAKRETGGGALAPKDAKPSTGPVVDSEIVFWRSVRDSQDPEDYRAYLRRWPKGTFADLARNRIKRLLAARSQGKIVAGACEKAATPSAGIVACSRDIASGQYAGKALAQKLARRGLAYHRAKKYQKAIDDFSAALLLAPDDAAIHGQRAASYYRLGRLKEAIADYTRVVNLDAASADTYFNRGVAYYRAERFTEALNDLNVAIKENPKFANAFFARAVVYQMALRKPEKAAADYKIYLKWSPQGSLAKVARQRIKQLAAANRASTTTSTSGKAKAPAVACTAAVGDPKQMVAACTREIDSGNLRGAPLALRHHWRANAFRQRKRFELAILDYNHAIRLNPRDAAAYINRGIAYYRLKQFQRAIQDYNRAIRMRPRSANAYFNRGVAHFRIRKPHKALADLRRTIALDRSYANAHFVRGVVYEEALQDPVKAVAAYRAYVRQEPAGRMAAAARERLKALAASAAAAARKAPQNDLANCGGKIQKIDACTRLIQSGRYRGGRLINFRFNRGLAYYRAKRYRDAFADFNWVLRYNRRHSGAMYHRAIVNHYALGRRSAAIADYRAYLRMAPSGAFARYARRALVALGVSGRGATGTSTTGGSQTTGDHSYCNRKRQIASYCTRILRRGGLSLSQRALIRFYRARAYMNARRYRLAVADMNYIVRVYPRSPGAYNNRGVAYRRMGNHTAAIRDYRRALAINSRYHMAYYNLGLIYQHYRRNRSLALSYYRRAYRISRRSLYARAIRQLGGRP